MNGEFTCFCFFIDYICFINIQIKKYMKQAILHVLYVFIFIVAKL